MHQISFIVWTSKLTSQNSAGGEMFFSFLATTPNFPKIWKDKLPYNYKGSLVFSSLLFQSMGPTSCTSHFTFVPNCWQAACENALAITPVPHLQHSCCLGPPRCQLGGRSLLPWLWGTAAAHTPGLRWLRVVSLCSDSDTVLSPGIWARASPAANNTTQAVWVLMPRGETQTSGLT